MNLPKRKTDGGYVRPPRESFAAVRDVASALAEAAEAKAAKRGQRKTEKKKKAKLSGERAPA